MTRPSTRSTVIIGIAAALTLASIAATLAFALGRYPAIPELLAVHFRGRRPDVFMVRSYGIVLLPVWTQLILALVIGAVAALLLYRAREGAEEDPTHRVRMLHSAEAVAILGFIWIGFQFLTQVAVIDAWTHYRPGMGRTYYFALATCIVLSIVVAARMALQIGRPAASHTENQAVWRLKALYFNPADPALFVPARYGYGLTLNFGRPLAIAVMLGILLGGLGGPFLLARFLLRY